MSIPTHNLYDFVHQATKRQFWILYFYPWGSRELEKLIDYQTSKDFLNSINGIPVENRFDFDKFNIPLSLSDSNLKLTRWTQPIMLCHDQEPLDFKLYAADSELIRNYDVFSSNLNNLSLKKRVPYNIYKKLILLHSEVNSTELAKFENTNLFAGAYWWSHAIIARDWYRYAKHDLSLLHSASRKKLFLTYCRRIDVSSSYRQDFLNYISIMSLENSCLMSSESLSSINSTLSSEYHSIDFVSTAISVVLETTFDARIHLTEKTLRPIACGHPFIIANGPGCLRLLKKYGFKTFHPFINESYDNIVDHSQRLLAIVNEMKRLQQLSNLQLDEILNKCKSITEYNKKLFFSDEFLNQVTNELLANVNNASVRLENDYDIKEWLNIIKDRRDIRKMGMPVNKDVQNLILFKLIKKLKKTNL